MVTISEACGAQRTMHVEAVPERTSSLQVLIGKAFQAACHSLDHIYDIAYAITSGPNDSSYPLHPEEVRALRVRACPKRRLTWSAGRLAAKLVLKQMGITELSPMLCGSLGEPLWPKGISGSITHCHPWSVAAGVQSGGGLFIGIDLESVNRIQDTEIASVVCGKSELEWVCASKDTRERLCMIFSAKEALYKSLYPSYKRYIDFKEVELTFSDGQRCFHATIPPAENHPQGRVSSIAALRHDDLIFSCSVYETQ